MSFLNSFARVAGVALMLVSASGAWGQSAPWPIKPVRIVTTEPGSGGDIVPRLMIGSLSGTLGQQFIVDNRGIISGEVVAKAAPDGYTLLSFGSSLWLGPFLRDNVPYEPLRDFAPITVAVSSPNILVVHPSFPAKSVKELIAVAKARPGQFNYAASGAGSSNHLSAELFKAMAGVSIERVFYKGPATALNDLLAGQVQVMFVAAATGLPHLKSERLRALAITSAQPSALAPDLPTMAASGLPGYESVLMVAQFAPAGTPAAIVNRLNQEMVRILRTSEVKDKLLNTGAEVIANTPGEAFAAIKADMTKWGKLIKDTGIRAE